MENKKKFEKQVYMGTVVYNCVNNIGCKKHNKEYHDVVISICIPKLNKEEMIKLLEIEKDYTAKLTLEVEESILDEEERDYLKSVIRPFRNRVKCISKHNSYSNEYICIELVGEYLNLPFFKKGTMYKGMERGKEYSVEDLGL